MKLVSTAATPQARRPVPHVFETSANARSHTVAIGQGQLLGSDIHLADADADALESLAALTQLEHPGAMVHFAELDGVDNVEERMGKVFAALEDGAPVMFLCRNSAVCDAAREALHVRGEPSAALSH